jgi:hypothetical protein
MNNTYKTNKNGEGFFYVSPQYLHKNARKCPKYIC